MHGPVTNIDTALSTFDEHWSPRVLARVNDWDVRLARVQGSFIWHSHQETDELFVVLEGSDGDSSP